MIFSDKYICAGEEFCGFEKAVPAPYIRKTFNIAAPVKSASLTVGCPGFYRAFLNGEEITKGLLAPYISNPDELVFYDSYDVTHRLVEGKNTLVFLLGNGMINCPGGAVWDFDKESFRASPRVAFALDCDSEVVIEADGTEKCHASPIYFDDLRCGERYDAGNEITGVLSPDFNDSGWANAVLCAAPKGGKTLCDTDPILKTGEELKPVSITEGERSLVYDPHHLVKDFDVFEKYTDTKGYIYDFGVNTAGVFRLKIHGEKGQRVELQFAEILDDDGKLFYGNIHFFPDGFSQHDVYILSGEGEEVWEPSFTYHGARYCLVTGITPEQATPELLTYLPAHSALERVGGFECSDETANTLYKMTVNSDLSNFFYFPTDCPHREKNGWMGDAAMSAEHFFMNYDCLKSLSVWLSEIRAAQSPEGALPCMVPTGSWGRDSGPTWDAALTYLPYNAYRFTGDIKILEDNADAIEKYLKYTFAKRNEYGLLDLYLGDWVPVADIKKASTEFTDSVSFMSICKKAEFIFETLGRHESRELARSMREAVRDAVRTHLLNRHNLIADTGCQTSQAMAIYNGVFNSDEYDGAFRRLVKMVHDNEDFFDCGMLGVRYLFRVLAEGGEVDLAYKLITRPEWPSYAHYIGKGLTAIPENFYEGPWDLASLNHHFLGDISGFFISEIAGLVFNPTGRNVHEFSVKPHLPEELDRAKAYYKASDGLIEVEVFRKDGKVETVIRAPENMKRI